jgi:hypothetical protein
VATGLLWYESMDATVNKFENSCHDNFKFPIFQEVLQNKLLMSAGIGRGRPAQGNTGVEQHS